MEIAIREASAEDVRGVTRVHVEAWKSTYRGLVSSQFMDKISFDERETMWTKVIDGKLCTT